MGLTAESYLKRRTASYCDRILFRGGNMHIISCEEYNFNPGVSTSDHKPVTGTLVVTKNELHHQKCIQMTAAELTAELRKCSTISEQEESKQCHRFHSAGLDVQMMEFVPDGYE